MIGEKLGPYEILESIGSGGMGEVWKARDTRLGRIVAIKKVKEQHSERFKQEARTIAALNHPNICQIFDIGDDYLVLEYVKGKPLLSPLPEQEAVRLAIQIATALEESHQHGIIHRDLKPSNIMVGAFGEIQVMDWGFARHLDPPHAKAPEEQGSTSLRIMGTPAYMPPEQWKEIVSVTKEIAEICLAIAMAAVGLGTSIKGLVDIGLKPLGVGLFSALLVGGVSITLISLLY